MEGQPDDLVQRGLDAGALLGARFRLERRLGRGAVSAAWVATDLATGRSVALKLQRDVDGQLAGELERLRGLRHPRLVEIHAFGRHALGREHVAYLVTTLVDGRTLDAWAPGRAARAVSDVVVDALEGLVFLHDAGIRHGDVKPENVVVGSDGRGVLIDLGLAAPLDRVPTRPSGTPRYMAPELLDARAAGARADLYAVGITLRRALELAGAEDDALEAIASRACAPAPADRPADGRVLLELLGRAAPALSVASGRAPRMLDREPLVACFERALAACAGASEGPRLLWFEGPDGIGRTRLLRELSWTAQASHEVHETWTSGGAPLRDALARILDAQLGAGLEAVLEARDAIARRDAPLVLIADDVHRWPASERAALEALARTAEPTGALLVAAAARPGAIELGAGPALERHELPTLSERALREWCEPLVTPSRIHALAHASGGFPADVEWLSTAMACGAIAESELSRARVDAAADEPLVVPLQAPVWRRVAAALAATEGRLDDASREGWEIDEATLLALQHAGLVRREEAVWRLARPSDLDRIRAAADRAQLRAMHGQLAEALERAAGEQGSRRRAHRARHLALAGRTEAALVEVARCDEEARALAAADWMAAVDAIDPAALASDFDGAIGASHILSEAGSSLRALSVLAALLRRRPGAERAAQIRTEAGGALLRAGRARRARTSLRRALEDAIGASRVEALALLSRTLVELGEFADAERCAEESLAVAQSIGAPMAAAYESLGVARIYLGRADAADALTEAWHRSAERAPRQRAKLSSFLAIADFRKGELAAARERYVEALALAEQHGLMDLLATAALNLGTVEQQLGDWGAALRGYERALRAARALARSSTEVTVLHNLANLYASIGLPDRAEHALRGVEARQAAEGLRHLEGSAASLRGELARAAGRLDVAAEAFGRALAAFEARGATREVVECSLQLSACAREERRMERARRWLDRAEQSAAELGAADVDARVLLERGRASIADGRGGDALRPLERALARARHAGELHLEGEVEAALAHASAAAGASALAEAHAARARERFERIALTLPEAYRETFWRHPTRAIERASAPVAPPRLAKAERLLEINKRLNSTLSTEVVLEHAIDAAIELTGAERGFVLLGPGASGGLDVAAARNLDRERVGRSHLKFSRSVAEGVVRSGEPVLTTDARADARFRENESVHAMRLSSIVCVPIAAPAGVLGAIYLDNRFERGRFTEADVSTLAACADQVALALTNARLVSDLERRSRELEAERDRVGELLREREARIEHLEEEAARGERPLDGSRYEYPEIVGRGAAMRSVLSVLDRVIESPLSVVIEGESGTGKELIARAIHHQGPRRDAPMRAVNCGALPDALLEGELFGWTRGAFTGADRARDGVFVVARGGTVFLDEVGEMSTAMQTKLLRVLQQREVQPLGAAEAVEVDVRIVAATNRHLRDEVAAGRFREDLFYRLAVIEVRLPPLRERKEELPELVHRLLERRASEMSVPVPRVHPDAMRGILRHDWPGNVRELENTLSRALVMGDGELLRPADLGLGDAVALPRGRREMDAEQTRRILAALADTGWNVSEVSRRLGIPRTTLYRKLKRSGIESGPPRSGRAR